jgi:DNA-directed RNA polymerase specialized sigma24 family protein
MNDPQDASAGRLASALLAASPDTLPEALSGLFDAYADELFGYCWFMLRNADLAQIALRDTLVVAQAHIGRLAETGNLDSWLYSLARAECRRRRPVPPGEADEPPARPSQPDADSRLMAWNAVTSMDADAMEVLDLACRRDVDLGLVLGLPGHEARGLLDSAREELEQALGAEILVSRAGHACTDRADVMRGWTGTMTVELRERVLRHAASCRVCGPSLPRNVSATRVFALLPVPPLPAGTRERVLDFFADPRMSAYREFAVTRVAEFGPGGFPSGAAPLGPAGTLPLGLDDALAGDRADTRDRASARDGAGTRNRGRSDTAPSSRRMLSLSPRARVLAAAGAATVAAAVAAAFVLGGQGNQTRSLGQGASTSSGGGPVVPRRAGAGAEGAVPVGSPTAVVRSLPRASASASELLFDKVTQPLVSPTRGNPPLSPPRLPDRPLPPPPASSSQPKAQPSAQGTLQVSPGTLSLGTSSEAELTITADGAAQTWSASTASGQLVLGASGGTLRAGQSVTLTVGVERNNSAGGSAVIFIDQGSASAQTVRVSWTEAASGTGHQRPPTPTPSPTPSSSPSSSPSPSPSPSPSTSSGSSPPSPHSSPPPHHHPSPAPTPSQSATSAPTQSATASPTPSAGPSQQPAPTITPTSAPPTGRRTDRR